MRLRTILCAFALAFGSALAGEQELSKGFDHFYNLEYDQAIAEFNAEIAKQPDNPNLRNHLAQCVLYREMFRAGALESELVSGSNPFLRRQKLNPDSAAQRQFDEAIQKAMDLSQGRIEKDANDADALYALGVAHGLRANYNFLVRKAYMDALHDATQARKLHSRVAAIRPDFVDAKLIEGVHDYVIGSLPFRYRMFGFLVGFHGDKEGGIKELESVARDGRLNKTDAQILLAAIYRRERRSNDAVPLLADLVKRFPRNYLLRFELAQMYGDLGDKTNALAAIAAVDQMKQSKAAGYTTLPWAKIYYFRGNILFWYWDLDQALVELKKATATHEELDLNTETFTLLRLGQTYDLKGSRPKAMEAYRQLIALSPESDAAKEGKRYLSTPYRRDKG